MMKHKTSLLSKYFTLGPGGRIGYSGLDTAIPPHFRLGRPTISAEWLHKCYRFSVGSSVLGSCSPDPRSLLPVAIDWSLLVGITGEKSFHFGSATDAFHVGSEEREPRQAIRSQDKMVAQKIHQVIIRKGNLQDRGKDAGKWWGATLRLLGALTSWGSHDYTGEDCSLLP